jgi:hypothetical protein
MPDLNPQLDFNVGLVGVTFQQEADAPRALPTLETIAPGNGPFELQLQEVLYVPASQEQRLLASLRPEIAHRDLLRPWAFYAMTAQVLEWLREKARTEASEEDRGKMRKAAQTLEEFDALTMLLRRFQHALHRG